MVVDVDVGVCLENILYLFVYNYVLLQWCTTDNSIALTFHSVFTK